MAYPIDLQGFITLLEERGKLFRFHEPINKDTEIVPLLRLQTRGLEDADRKVLMYENVVGGNGQKFDIKVCGGVYGITEEIALWGMGCETWKEAMEKWHACLEKPIPPVVVASGPVQEVVQMGEDLKKVGLDEIPSPVEDPGFSQMIRTGLPMITQDPETGIKNIGTFNGFMRDRDRMVAAISFTRETMKTHWRKYRERGEEMPLAIVVGATPNVHIVSSAAVPYGMDELAVASAMAGEPMELVKCKTIPLEVPAHAQIVIEGMVSTDLFEPRFGFGEYPGYLNMERNMRPVMRVTAITRRKDAIFTPIMVGMTPSDCNAVWNLCNAGIVYHRLRYEKKLPVSDVYFPQMGGANDFCLVQLEKGNADRSREVLEAAAAAWPAAKYTILLDHDLNIQDPDILIWALAYRVQPNRDTIMIHGRHGGLDPSSGATGFTGGTTENSGDPMNYYRMAIDATMKGPYPPVALPRKEYMENALDIWSKHQLPAPKLREPWHGYTLGYWTDEDQKLADLMVKGDYKAVGRVAKELQKPTEEVFSTEAKKKKQQAEKIQAEQKIREKENI